MKKVFIIISVCISFITFVLIFISVRHKAATSDLPNATSVETANKINQPSVANVSNSLELNDELAEDSFPVKLLSESNIYFELAKSFPNLKSDKLSLISPIGESGNPLSLSEYLNKVGSSMPNDIVQDSTIKMYIFRGKKDFGPSEALVVKNRNDAGKNYELLKKHEAEIIERMKGFVLIGEKYDLIQSSGRQNRQFSDSAFYRNGRYVNYTSDKAISLNCVAANNYIIFANSLSILHNVSYKIFTLESL